MPQDQKFDALIVGGGQAGGQAACALRAAKFTGTIAIIGEEPDAPYERPPRSKDYLLGEKARERLYFRNDTFWADQKITLLTGERVVAVDPEGHQVTTDGGKAVAYGSLIWAAGGIPRTLALPGIPKELIFTIRSLADIDRLKAKLTTTTDVAIIGGGYIGLEAAAVLRKLGKGVDLIELAPRLLSRVAAPEISAFFERVHQDHGVKLHLGTSVERAEVGERLTLLLQNGDVVTSDLIIIGIGIDPNVAPLAATGAAVENGLKVDEFCRTSLADIYAIGDCVSFISPYAGDTRVRLESVQNANDQAKVATRHIVGHAAPYTALPWFWSDQYDLKLQTLGLAHGYDATLLRGDPKTNSFSLLYFRRGALCAIDSINRPLDFAQGRLLLSKEVDREDPRLQEVETPLKALVS